ncbi:MAG: YceI family protein [Burkholderiales bacterium]
MPFKKGMLVAVLTGAMLPCLATADTYTIDPLHTYPSIAFSHMGISVWRGKFNKTHGTITLDRAAKTGTADIVIDVASINFGLDAMDEKARSDDFFDVSRFPTATYKGVVKFNGDKPASVDGKITIRGITRPVMLHIELFNCITHPMLKKEVCGAEAQGEVNWSEYGMKMSQYGQGDAGKVQLRIQVEAIKND